MATLYNHFRDSYDGHEGVRGRADLSVVTYDLSAPLIVAGEESADEAAIRERSIELLFSKKDLKNADHRMAFNCILSSEEKLSGLWKNAAQYIIENRSRRCGEMVRRGQGKVQRRPSEPYREQPCLLLGGTAPAGEGLHRV